MSFDTSPEAMESEGEIWFPGDHSRLRWWVTEGKCGLVRPGLDPSLHDSLGLDDDPFWACVGHLGNADANRLFAEWVVGRPDLGITVKAAKLETALDAFYDRLEQWIPEGWDRTLSDAVGRDVMRGARLQFASASPSFCILSTTERAPVTDRMPEELLAAAEVCENVLPMKKSVYYRHRDA